MSKKIVRYSVIPRVLIFVLNKDKLLLIKYTNNDGNTSREKKERKGMYNCIGGHIEMGEDILETAVREAQEEANITLQDVHVRGVINVTGFANKNILNFIVVGTTNDIGISSSLEGELKWVLFQNIQKYNIFSDIKPILEKLLHMNAHEFLLGTALYGAKFTLIDLQLRIV